MYVPNYIPEPLEVPGNITLRPYQEKIRFIRRVVALHTVSILCVAALTFSPGRNLSTEAIVIGFVSMLLLLDLLRIRLRGRELEAKISAPFLPIVVLLTGWICADLSRHGWPAWSALVGVFAVGLYTIACGKDFSFIGCLFLSLFASMAAIFMIGHGLHLAPVPMLHALLLNAAYLCYYVYDLASLLARRRENETLAAVLDLYRDYFNIFGWVWRCLRHWKKHHIWVNPK